jgi:hypothetical protein
MGIRTALKLLEGGKSLTPGAPSNRTRTTSPWRSGALSRPLVEDVWGTDSGLITREQAMSIPPFYKGRGIIVSQIAPAPLRNYGPDSDVPTAEQPKWLYRTDGAISPHHRMIWTLDDIITTGWSLWGCLRDADGKIETANRIPIEWWDFDADGGVNVKGEPIDEAECILIPGPSEGFLEYAQRSMRGAVDIENSWIKRARNPIPLVELHETADGALEDGEAEELVSDYVDARNDPNGAVSFTPFNIELKVHGEQAAPVSIEARNASKLDVGNFLMLPAAALDGSLSTASLTYSTGQDKRNEIADYSISYWADPIAARFSQDDVSEPGDRTRFDFSQIRAVNPSPTGPITKD